MARAKSSPSSSQSSATIGFASRVCGIWLAADKLRNNMGAAPSALTGKHARALA